MEIRLARGSDVPVIARIHVDSWQQTYSGLLPRKVIDQHSYPDRLALWEKIYQSDRTLVAIDEHSGRLLGFITGGPQRSHPEMTDYPGEIYGLYVDPKLEHHGIGTRLFYSKRAELLNERLLPFTIDCLSSNVPALGFYQSHGGELLKSGTYVANGCDFETQVLTFNIRVLGLD